jgi:deoxyribodipyrimidine photo-lyase
MLEFRPQTRAINQQLPHSGPVIYWMNREMRITDNWALIQAMELANTLQQPFAIIFSLFSSFGVAKNTTEDKMFNRMKLGLKHVMKEAKNKGIPFYILHGPTVKTILSFLKENQVGLLVTDFSPLNEMRSLREDIAKAAPILMLEVDGHNIVPFHLASTKQEWGAYTLRPKITKLLPTFLVPYPKLPQCTPMRYEGTHDESFLQTIEGEFDPASALSTFLEQRLNQYEHRNDPNLEATSRLSSYFHFGHLSSQTVALKVKATSGNHDAFLEELIVRKELADNFCFYNRQYDRVEGFPEWARKTLAKHQHDPREYLYSEAELAEGKTHDDAWNAAQLQMVKTGYMHGYMRMYWAKKILEWTKSAEEALTFANALNDRYELDGRDPNGYTGTAWAIGGVHDRPWQERPIFGMIRYMNAAGLKRKFDVGQYIQRWSKR